MTLLDPGMRTLDEIAESIRSHYATGFEANLAIGRDLAEARTQFPSDPEFGQWFAGQGFDFAPRWARVLRAAAEHEDQVRVEVTRQLTAGKKANIETALTAVLHPEPDEEPAVQPEPATTDVDVSAEYRALMRAMKEFLDLRPTVNTVRMNWTPDQKRLLQERAEVVIRLAQHIHSPQAGRITLGDLTIND